MFHSESSDYLLDLECHRLFRMMGATRLTRFLQATPHLIQNLALSIPLHCDYICECSPMSVSAIKAQWGPFGHVMRMAHDTPAQMAIDEYIAPTATAGWQGRPRTTLPTTIDNDLQGVGEMAPQQARLATFKNIRQKSMAYP